MGASRFVKIMILMPKDVFPFMMSVKAAEETPEGKAESNNIAMAKLGSK